MTTQELIVATADGPIQCTLLSPRSSESGVRSALLLSFAATRQAAFEDPPQNIPALIFAEAGHAVVSFDLPQHGARVDRHGAGIDGFRTAYLAGDDPFRRFVRDASTVIDHCLAAGLGGGGIVACGVSRAGYCALRLAAADQRIMAAAALAPVTDWQRLREFAAVADDPRVKALALKNWVPDLAQRNLFLAIGHRDARVGTDACVALAQHIYASNMACEHAENVCQLHVVEAPDHALPDRWRKMGAQFLLRHLGADSTR